MTAALAVSEVHFGGRPELHDMSEKCLNSPECNAECMNCGSVADDCTCSCETGYLGDRCEGTHKYMYNRIIL